MAVMATEAAGTIGEIAEGSAATSASESSAASSIRGDTPGPTRRRNAIAGGSRGSAKTSTGKTSSGSAKGSRTQPRAGGVLARRKGRSWDEAFKAMTGKTNGAPLLAEYIGGVVIICLGTLTRGPSQGYTNVMSELMLRLTALTTVFFILFLLAGSKAGKSAVWFGLLVDLGILFTAATENVLSDTASLISNTSVGGGSTLLASGGNLDQPEPPPSVTLPEGTAQTGPQTA